MPSIVKILRVVADPNRLRILLLLRAEELSVAELQEILVMGQSTISTHLSQLKQAGLVEDRRTGKSNLYHLKGTGFSPYKSAPTSERALQAAEKGLDLTVVRRGDPAGAKARVEFATVTARLKPCPDTKPPSLVAQGSFPAACSAPAGTSADSFLHELLARAATEIPEAAPDQAAMRSVLRKRQDKMRAFFDSVAGRLGKDYVPGQSWKGVAEALLRLMPPMTIADLGAGEGTFALLLAQRAKKVIAVDTSARMIEVSRDQALRHGIANVEFRLGDMEEIPIADGEVDLVFFSQSLHHALHPDRAIEEAARILVPGGRIVLLDLAKHRFEEARELYADEWLGFSEAELESMLQKAGFTDIQTSVVHKEPETPQFQTLLAVADKPVN